ncbi:hypothetical protein GGX14DRAFT_624640 [Mycena pura]|uniref:Uncharacterized protein n=1 Tax=Mycena pura TaxID=153505 RepID=A0AAD6YE02_9AGAR|nr:hypothetical protein GGX14DRAFT_624640 [Mycena pura]
MDSYLTDLGRPGVQAESCADGRALVDAAHANLVDGGHGLQVPSVTMRLTRLDPAPLRADGAPNDPHARTVQCLRDMGVDVELGERRRFGSDTLDQPRPVRARRTRVGPHGCAAPRPVTVCL